MLGLSRDNLNTDWTDIDFAIYLYSNGAVFVVEGGLTRGVFGTYETGDRLQVAIEAGQVVYRRNGTLLYTASVAPGYPMKVDVALLGTGVEFQNVVMSFVHY